MHRKKYISWVLRSFAAALAIMAAILPSRSLGTTIVAAPLPPPPPYTVAEVLPCLERPERDVCLLRMFVIRGGQSWLPQWFEIYGDPELASAIGVDLTFENLTQGGVDEAGLAYALDRDGASPTESLKPFTPLLTSQFGERYIGLEQSGLMTLIEMGRDPLFPIRNRPSADLVAEAQYQLETGLREQSPILRPQSALDYIGLLLRVADQRKAAKIEGLAWQGYTEKNLTEESERIARQAQVGNLEAAATSALGLTFSNSSMRRLDAFRAEIFDTAIVVARITVAREAERQGRTDIALVMAKRVLEDACPASGTPRVSMFAFQDMLPLLLRNVSMAEAIQWTERVEVCGGSEKVRIDAASAAFHAWRKLGQTARAHGLLESWRPLSGSGNAKYDFQPKGFVVSMLLAEGRVDEAWTLAPSASILLELTKINPGNIDLILAKVPTSQRFAALEGCREGLRLGYLEPCAARLENEALTAAQKLGAAGILIGAIGRGSPGMYGPWSYDIPVDRDVIDARFNAVSRLLRDAVESDDTILQAPLEAEPLRRLVRMSLTSKLRADRAKLGAGQTR